MLTKEILRLKGTTLFTVTPEATLADALDSMVDHDIGSLVVMDHGRLAGMLTFREVLRMLAKRQTELRVGPTRPVAEIVVSDVFPAAVDALRAKTNVIGLQTNAEVAAAAETLVLCVKPAPARRPADRS